MNEFKIKNNNLTGIIHNFNFKPDKWIKDTNSYNIITYNIHKETYQTGFHFFLNKEDAEKCMQFSNGEWILKKVKVRNVITTGLEHGYREFYKAGIAREIFIEEV